MLNSCKPRWHSWLMIDGPTKELLGFLPPEDLNVPVCKVVGQRENELILECRRPAAPLRQLVYYTRKPSAQLGTLAVPIVA